MSSPAYEKLDGSRVYLDANIVITLVEIADTRLARVLERAMVGRLRLVTSELTLAEVLVRPLRDGDQNLSAIYRDLFSRPQVIECVPVAREVLELSCTIRAEEGGKLADSIHVATAEASNCAVFLSSDRRIKTRKPMIRIGIDDIPDTP
ncbi:type II toxin-antitoxin system VapC family toxin [Salinarimonas sp.]|uniref:type II toxin-antitoxin system VapC family toxin n=1 Tax=Salinarimonas sp. TaxID=2766526 RepID=UPI00391C7346